MKSFRFIKSKKFWTLVAAIVAALSAYFASSCSAQYVEIRKGLHTDSVYFYTNVKTNNNK